MNFKVTATGFQVAAKGLRCCPLSATPACLSNQHCQRHISHQPRILRYGLATTRVRNSETRPFSTSLCLAKKGGKAAREEKRASENSENGASDDPFDFTILEADISSIIDRLKSDLSKLRVGGRFNPEAVENLRVQPNKTSSETLKLSDLAQIIPKGRTLQIIVGEKDHVKSVSAAIQGSTLSLTPQPDATGSNPLLLVLNIPPPTAESRRAAVSEATKAGEKAGTSVRDARGKQQKKLRALQLNKAARPDDIKKASGTMEKTVEKGNAEVKKIVDNAKNVLESG